MLQKHFDDEIENFDDEEGKRFPRLTSAFELQVMRLQDPNEVFYI